MLVGCLALAGCGASPSHSLPKATSAAPAATHATSPVAASGASAPQKSAAAAGSHSASALRPLSFQTSWVPAGNQLPWYYAYEKGYFKDVGLKVTIASGRGSVTTDQQVGHGVVDLAQSDLTIGALSRSKGIPIEAVYVEFPKSVYGILAAKSEGIKTFADLKGKTILRTPGDVSQFLLPAALQKVGLSMADVHLISVSPSEKDKLYYMGKADAAVAEISHLPTAKRPSYALAFGDVLNVPYLGIVGRPSFVKAHPGEVRAFIRATSRALQALISSPAAVKQVAQYIASTHPGASAKVLASQWGTYRAGDFRIPSQKGHPLGWMPPSMWSNTIRILHEYAGLKHPLPAGDYYTNAYVTGS